MAIKRMVNVALSRPTTPFNALNFVCAIFRNALNKCVHHARPDQLTVLMVCAVKLAHPV